MKKSTFICTIILALFTVAGLIPFFKHTDKLVANEWEQGEFVTFRKTLLHECGGQLVFNGRSKPAPYCESDNFCEHVCDKCSATNQVLNATWPKYKNEWRAL